MIREAFKRLYAGDDALQNHLILFVLTGFVVMLSKVLNMYSTPPLVDNSPVWLLFVLLILIMVVNIYLDGYMYVVNHRAYDDSTPELLPNFTLEGFKIFFKFLPVGLFWFLIGLLIVWGFNVVVPLVPVSVATFVTWKVLYNVSMIFLALLIPFVLARFCENYDRKGLYNPLVPIKDLFKSAKEIGILILKLIPIGVVLLTFLVFGAPYDIVGFIFTALFSYCFTLALYVVNYSYVQIYREKISKEK